MSTRFFASVRRNQRQWMVVVTVLSMVSFLFLDDFGRGRGPMSAFGGALMIGFLCAAGMCIIGYPRQKTAEFGVGGFLVGFIVGFLGFGAVAGNRPVVRTAAGSFTRTDLELMASHRQKVNQFMFGVDRKVKDGSQNSFGPIDDQSLIAFRMLLADAKQMGIQISDEAVNDFLKKLSKSRLTNQDFKECLRDARLSEGELFDLLKDELSAQLVAELIQPPAFIASAPPQFAQYAREPLRYMEETPEQKWEAYQMLNLKESLFAVAVPVKDFVSQTGEPSEMELGAFFEKHKNKRWVDESQPGFTQMPRVQIAYLTADFEKFEKGLDPTDEDIRNYYEKNKDRYRAPAAKESTAPKLPDDETPATKESPAGGEAAKTEGDVPPKDGEQKADPAPGDEAKKPGDDGGKPAAPTGQKDAVEKKPDGEKPAAPEPAPKSESNCGDDEPAKEKVTAEPAAEKPAAEKPAEEKPAAGKPAEPASTDAPADPARANDPATTETPPPAMPKLSTSMDALPEAKYRDLNETLTLEIREAILRERAFARMATAIEDAYEKMKPLGLDYDTTIDTDQKKQKAKRAEKAAAIAEELKKYALDHNLEYKETPEVTYDELALEPLGASFEGQSRSPVVNEVFMPGPKGEPRMPQYLPHRADLRPKSGAFAYWKTGDAPATVMDPKDESVHAKLVSAWKFDQARSVAEKRAKELAEKAKAGGSDLAATLSGESVTGAKNDPAVSIIDTPEFTWLSTPKSVPGAQQDPMISDIALIDNVGNDFMKTVFDELGDGEIGVASNELRTIYYVLKVKEREGSKNDDGGVAKQGRQQQFLKERFTGFYPIIKSPYEALAQYPQRQIDQAWRQNFERRHSVEWEEESAPVRKRR